MMILIEVEDRKWRLVVSKVKVEMTERRWRRWRKVGRWNMDEFEKNGRR